jgi:hypothetical protein
LLGSAGDGAAGFTGRPLRPAYGSGTRGGDNGVDGAALFDGIGVCRLLGGGVGGVRLRGLTYVFDARANSVAKVVVWPFDEERAAPGRIGGGLGSSWRKRLRPNTSSRIVAGA